MSRNECEIELIYKMYRKNFEILEKNVAEHIRRAHDFDKWKKKFYAVFNREKIIEFTSSPSIPLEFKSAKIKPTSQTKEGKKILNSNSKFWVLYYLLIGDKINESNRDEIRTFLCETFKDAPESDMNFIKQELGVLLQFPVEINDKENE